MTEYKQLSTIIQFHARGVVGRYQVSNSSSALPEESSTTKSAWWVNQGQAYTVQREGGYLWAPKVDRRGIPPIHWRSLADVKEGDVIVHHTHGAIVAVSLALADAYDAERPPALAEASDTPWQSDGRRIDVRYVDVDPNIPTDRFMKRIAALNIDNGPVDAAYRAKQGYLFRLTPEALAIIEESSEVEWPQWATIAPLPTRRWLFQANPRFWDLERDLESRTEGDSDSWLVTRMGNEMEPGDSIVFWQSGPNAGIYALGVLTSRVHERPTPDWQREAGETADSGLSAEFTYTKILQEPVLRTELKSHPVLQGLAVIQAPQGTNFRVSEEQWQAIQSILEDGPTLGNWDEFIFWARRFYEWDEYDATERDYKLDYADMVAQARREFLDGDEQWFASLKRSLNGSAHPVSWRVSGEFRNWCKEHPDQARKALSAIWQEDLEPVDRVRSFLDLLPYSGVKSPSGRISLAAYLQSALGPTSLPIYRVTVFGKAFKLVDYPSWPEEADEAGCFEYAVRFLDDFMTEAAKAGLEIQDRLDAQGLTWLITQWPGYDHWSDEEREAFLRFQSGESPQADVEPERSEPDLPTTSELADQLLIDEAHIEEIQYLLSDKRQLIFYGPPGTGKTFLAKALAEFFAINPEDREEDGMVKIVQFHPSYAYEDFVQGYRPQTGETEPRSLRWWMVRSWRSHRQLNPSRM